MTPILPAFLPCGASEDISESGRKVPSVKLLLLVIITLFASLPALAEFVPGNSAPDTLEFLALAQGTRTREGKFDRAHLSPYKILLVPGLVTDVTEEIGLFTRWIHLTPTAGFLSSFYQQRSWMTQNGIDFEVAPINRSGSCDENGDTIA